MFDVEDYDQNMIQSLYVDEYAASYKWMTLPTMGHVVMPMAFFLRSPFSPSSGLIVITYVNYCHFVQVYNYIFLFFSL